MVPFLELVANHILAYNGTRMQDLCLVFPNRRSILYFNLYLSQKVHTPMWAPRCVTISEFIQSFSNLQKADNLQLLLELHQVYCKTRPSTETFDSFYFWGEVMLSDFDDIDKYMVSAEQLFKNVAALKNITDDFSYLDEEQIEAIKRFWGSYAESRQSIHHKEFTDIWTSMPMVYLNYKQRLKDLSLGYEGMIYRDVAELFNSQNPPFPEAESYAFIGFNALNECEKTIFRYFRNCQKALFYWDYEQEFREGKHEAGFFIDKNLQEFPQAADFNAFNPHPYKADIELISLPSQVGQAKLVGQLLQGAEDAPEKTAVLLTDENLLMPVLHAIPKEIKDINITMGYPVKNASLSSLIDILSKLYLNSKSSGAPVVNFYYKYVIETLTHPYILKIHPDEIHALVMNIFRLNRIYIEPAFVDIHPLLTMIFRKVENGRDFLSRIKEILQYFALNSTDESEYAENPAGIESEALSTLFAAINKLSETIEKIGASLDLALCVRILRKHISGLNIPFEGEPLKGIQLMGFLESRALDFENLIILGVNEGNLPKSIAPISFIPYNLRHGFRLPTPEYRDAMYAYYFYRIINRAKKVSLVYSSIQGGVGASEVSRYVNQIVYNGNYHVTKKIQTFNIVPVPFRSIDIPKSSSVMDKLKEYTSENEKNKYLSPSALTTYIDCPVRFYFRYIEGLKEFEQPGEEIDPSVFGTVLHSAMNAIYSNYKKQVLTKEILQEVLKNREIIEKASLKALDEEFLHTGMGEKLVTEGRNFIIFRILVKYIRQIIKTDIDHTPFTLKGLEENVISTISFSANGIDKQLKIGGIIDRIDEGKTGIRIIDYKTGKPEVSFKNINELFTSEEGQKSKKEIFQTILYAILYKKNGEINSNIAPALYVTRSLFVNKYDALIKLEKENLTDVSFVEEEFLDRLKLLIEEIFDPMTNFKQTTNLKSCTFCSYSKICNK